MALPPSIGNPAGMSTSNVSRSDRLSAHRFRVPVAVTGAAVFGLSLLMSVGPALGANNGSNGNGSNGGGNGTSGNMKVHDAATGVESGSGNEPHVCDFWLSFSLDAPFEAGTWVMVSWAPTGDGSTVASGVYDTSGDGIDSSGIMELPPGHYRVEWAATGATVSSRKTFWVDSECDETVTPVDEPLVEEPASPTEEESDAEDPASPVEEAALPADESPTEESPAEEAALVDEESPVEESVLAGGGSWAGDPGTPSDESPAEDSIVLPDDPGAQSDESAAVEPGSPLEEPATEEAAAPTGASFEEEPVQPVNPGSGDAGASPAQDPLEGASESGEPTMSDTAAGTLPVQSGLAATLGVLLLIVVHAATRRGRRIEL
jgi:hypothetical protein